MEYKLYMPHQSMHFKNHWRSVIPFSHSHENSLCFIEAAPSPWVLEWWHLDQSCSHPTADIRRKYNIMHRMHKWERNLWWGCLLQQHDTKRKLTDTQGLAQSLSLLKFCGMNMEKATAPHSSTLAWKIPWMEEPGRLQSMGSLRVGHDWATSLSLFPFMHWRRKWQPTPVFLPGESQGRQSLEGCHVWGRTELDTTKAT